MDRLLLFLEKVPTTKIRILVTVFLIFGTGVAYLFYACHNILSTGACVNWEPSTNWYIFLSALAGVDITQYAAKSFVGIKHAQVTAQANDNAANVAIATDTPMDDTAEPVEPDVITTTDVSEIHTTIQEQKG